MANGTAAGVVLTVTASLSAGVARALQAWFHRPAGDVLERLAWLTEVLPAFNGGEQRRALLLAPRRSLEFDIMLTAAERRAAENNLHQWQARLWAVPIWPDAQPLPAALAPGATSIAIDTRTRDFHAGGLLGVAIDSRRYEVLPVQSVADAAITLAAPVVGAWAAGADVFPIRAGLMADSTALARFTGDVSYGRVRFELIEPCDWPASTESTYRGLPVLAKAPNWTEDIDQEFVRFLSRVDAGTGPVFVDDNAGGPHLLQSHRWLLDGRQAIDDFRQWLYARRGRFVSFWLPTFALDFLPVAAIGSGDTTIDVEHCDYTRAIAQVVARRDIRIELDTGATYYRRITGSTVISSSVERLTIDSALGVAAAPWQVRSISYMAAVRLEADAIELAWSGVDVAESKAMTRASRNDV